MHAGLQDRSICGFVCGRKRRTFFTQASNSCSTQAPKSETRSISTLSQGKVEIIALNTNNNLFVDVQKVPTYAWLFSAHDQVGMMLCHVHSRWTKVLLILSMAITPARQLDRFRILDLTHV